MTICDDGHAHVLSAVRDRRSRGITVGSPASAPADAALAAASSERAAPPPALPSEHARDRFWARYRVPLPPAEVYNPPGPETRGLQAGHWLTYDIPPELHGLGPGANGGGKYEWEVNLDIAKRTADICGRPYEVDILPTTIPVEYKASVFCNPRRWRRDRHA